MYQSVRTTRCEAGRLQNMSGGDVVPNESCHLKNGTKWAENKSNNHKATFIRNSGISQSKT